MSYQISWSHSNNYLTLYIVPCSSTPTHEAHFLLHVEDLHSPRGVSLWRAIAERTQRNVELVQRL